MLQDKVMSVKSVSVDHLGNAAILCLLMGVGRTSDVNWDQQSCKLGRLVSDVISVGLNDIYLLLLNRAEKEQDFWRRARIEYLLVVVSEWCCKSAASL